MTSDLNRCRKHHEPESGLHQKRAPIGALFDSTSELKSLVVLDPNRNETNIAGRVGQKQKR